MNGKALEKILILLVVIFAVIWIVLLVKEVDEKKQIEEKELEERNRMLYLMDLEYYVATEKLADLIYSETQKNNAINESQAYNYLAKGGTTLYLTDEDKEFIWLSRACAKAIPCTRVEEKARQHLMEREFPIYTVDTLNATDVQVSYFITNTGELFMWPPYKNEDTGNFYVDEWTRVVTPEGIEISEENEYLMYEDGFEFVVDGIIIKVSAEPENKTNILKGNLDKEELKNIPSIYYKDQPNAESPEGIESKFLYDSRGRDGNTYTIEGLDED